MSLLRLDRLSVRYSGHEAVRGLSLHVAAGEIVALVGRSGSGKSTAALASIGLLPRGVEAEGRVLVNDHDLAKLAPAALDRLRGATVGMIFQEPATALDPLMTIGAQVAEVVRRHAAVSRAEGRRRAASVLARVGLDPAEVSPDRYPHQLSGGQRQRAAIAVAIAAGPRLLVADEPTAALDLTARARVIDLLHDLVRQDGMGLLLVSHDLPLVEQVADRILVLADGMLVEERRAGGAPRSPQPGDAHGVAVAAGRLLIEADALFHRYPGAPRPAIDRVSIGVFQGERVGLVGESGSGKSTLVRMLLGLIPPDAGTIRVEGEPVANTRGERRRRWRQTVQAVFQDPATSFDPRWTVARIVAEPLHLLDRRPGRAELSARVETVLRDVGLAPEHATRRPHQLSGGQRQRVAIARALILSPALLLLDEATSALDPETRDGIIALLRDLSERRGLAYLFVAHDLAAVRMATERLLVMRGGQIVEEGATATVLAAPRHPFTAELIAATPALGG